MNQCPGCGSSAPPGGRFCSSCGAALPASSQIPTEMAGPAQGGGGAGPESTSGPTVPATSGGGLRRSSGSGLASDGRFQVGTLLAGRYRIIGRLGKGGMGEVYRADDLTLGQPVALKFLPEALSGNTAWMDRFLGEVRIARQISHPNVCRVYDIAEADGHAFISMEYVDGEDLASLLRRIGRYSKDKAVEISRQICAGLAAAHERGVLHRDLKPANIMIDGRGKVRITDFGLASLAGEVKAEEIRAGTPAYMAPEQLAGKEVTLRSDIYALGLVLYELFTGRPAHAAASREELLKSHSSGTITSPSSLAEEIDPAAERIILKCLEKDPRERPPSALAVAAALPGGDPLAAALAAGETPSPAMVAAAGEEGALKPAVAWGLLAAGVVLSLLSGYIGGIWEILRYVAPPLPPQALEVRAREVLGNVGHDAPVGDTASSYSGNFSSLNWIGNREDAPNWEAELRGLWPSPVNFWYRQSPRSMVARGNFAVVSFGNPALDDQGMARVVLGPGGRLQWFDAVPARHDDSQGPWEEPEWRQLFAEAGLEMETFEEVQPAWAPYSATDVHRAWEGTTGDRPDLTLRVEAAGYRGRPVSFHVYGPWDSPPAMVADTPTLTQWLARNLGMAVFTVGALAVGIIFAWRNIKAGRSDTRGAFRVAFWFFILHTAVWALWASHVADLNTEWLIVQSDVGYNLFLAASLWLLYVGLEPYVRRHWPDTIISWSRLLRGRTRDPLIGRDILIGGVLAGLFMMLGHLDEAVPLWMTGSIPTPHGINWGMLNGLGYPVANAADELVHALLQVMQGLFVILLLKILLRRISIACAVFVALVVLGQGALNVDHVAVSVVQITLMVSAVLYVLVRYGLVATTVGLYIANVLDNLGPVTDLSLWYAPSALVAVIAVLALLGWGFHISLAGQPKFGSGSLLDD